MALSQNCILNNEEINHKIRRIAYQIYESNVDENEVILAGIQSNGYILAEKIKKKKRRDFGNQRNFMLGKNK